MQGSTEISQSATVMKRLTYRSQASTTVFGLAQGRSDKIDSSRTHPRQTANQDCCSRLGARPFLFPSPSSVLLVLSCLSSSLPSLSLSLSLSSPLSPHTLIPLPSHTSWPVDHPTIMLGNSRAANPPRPASLLVLACIRPFTLRGSSLELDISFQGPN